MFFLEEKKSSFYLSVLLKYRNEPRVFVSRKAFSDYGHQFIAEYGNAHGTVTTARP